MKVGFLKINEISTTLLQIQNLYVKWWSITPDFTFGKIVFADKRFVWYIHFYKLEVAYEQFRNQ
jgi:hypothetical protein